jgi:AraC-like DNA-binding protein
VTAGHLIRQRVLTEAKRALVFTGQPIHEISYDLGFADPSHFARFFRKQTGTTPQAFREGRGGSRARDPQKWVPVFGQDHAPIGYGILPVSRSTASASLNA